MHCMMIREALDSVSLKNTRLIILTGRSGREISAVLRNCEDQFGFSRINVNTELSRGLLDLPPCDRPIMAERLLHEIIMKVEGEAVLLDRTEVLFSRDLALDPFRLLSNLGRYKTVIAAWNGDYDGSELVYAYTGHDDYRRYGRNLLGDTPILSVSSNGRGCVVA